METRVYAIVECDDVHDISNEKFIVYIGEEALNQIPNGPSIESSLDVYVPTLEINRYIQT